jgi:hypothetical protein
MTPVNPPGKYESSVTEALTGSAVPFSACDVAAEMDAGHHLADRPDSVGQLLVRHARHEVASRALLSGCEIQQVRGHPLPHRAEGVDRRLLQRLIQPSVQLLRRATGALRGQE